MEGSGSESLPFSQPDTSERIDLRGSGGQGSPVSSGKPVLKKDQELRIRKPPAPHRHRPLLGYFFRTHIDGLADGIVGWGNSLGLGKFPNHTMIPFHRICRVNDFPDLVGIFKGGHQLRPVLIP